MMRGVSPTGEHESRQVFREWYGREYEGVFVEIEREVIDGDYGANGYTTRAQVDDIAARLRLGAGTRVLDILRRKQSQQAKRTQRPLAFDGKTDTNIQRRTWRAKPSWHDGKWRRALGKLGIDLSMLSSDAGHA